MTDSILPALDDVIEQRKGQSADESYVASLLAEGLEKIQKKIGEEAIETILAAENGDDKSLVSEVSDLWFHTLVLLSSRGLSSQDVLKELERRFGLSGLEEKASRRRS
ncbi:MAG: phosphoribosyl-ATP pyrophosphohydrolase [Saprospiraceae bacterium]|jgi:phosphoribosyl-ATP pyrophosphohydrolase